MSIIGRCVVDTSIEKGDVSEHVITYIFHILPTFFSMSREFEIKAQLSDISIISPLLEQLSLAGEKEVEDIYYDTVDRTLFKNGIFVRIRDGSKFDIKYNPNLLDQRHVECQEYSYSFPLSQEHAQEIIAFLQPQVSIPLSYSAGVVGLVEFVPIIKHRKTYEGLGIEVAIDTVENLGTFLEIESKGETDRSIFNLQKSLGLTHIPIGYVELYLRHHDFPLYQKGRYLLEEDKIM